MTTTDAPASSSRLVVASPRPEAPPVTTATESLISTCCSSFRSKVEGLGPVLGDGVVVRADQRRRARHGRLSRARTAGPASAAGRAGSRRRWSAARCAVRRVPRRTRAPVSRRRRSLANTVAHSSRSLVLNTSVKVARSSSQRPVSFFPRQGSRGPGPAWPATRVELRLDRTDREVLAVGGLVGVVVGAPVSSMLVPRSSLHTPCARKAHIIWISTLEPSIIAASTTWPLPEVCRSHSADKDAQQQEHRPAAEVAGQVQRRHRAFTLAADRVQHTVRARCS